MRCTSCLTGESEGYYADFAGGGDRSSGQLGVLAKVLGRSSSTTAAGPASAAPTGGRRSTPGSTAGRRSCYLQTHDQVGNRAAGDRISASITPGRQAIGAALYLLSAFTPMVFMGEEWAASTPVAVLHRLRRGARRRRP